MLKYTTLLAFTVAALWFAAAHVVDNAPAATAHLGSAHVAAGAVR